jgi:hypothetical protein
MAVTGAIRATATATVVAALALAVAACGDGSGSSDRAAREVVTLPPRAEAPTTSAPPLARPDDVVTPRDAPQAAAMLTRVERGLRTNDFDARRTPAWGWEQQVAYGTLAAHPEWLPDVLGSLPADLRPVVQATYDAGAALSAPDLGHAPTELPSTPAELPDWTIVEPESPDVLVGYYREAEAEFGVPWTYLAAIHFVETKMGRIRGNSTAGAQGPMQFLPSTWAAYGAGGDITDDRDSILAAARYLRASGAPDDMARALRSYNPSDAYVAAITGYAEVIAAEPRAYNGFHAWQVFVATADGDLFLPAGWTRPS